MTDRAELEFTQAVRGAFGFLRERFNFEEQVLAVTLVRYTSTLVEINVYHGRSSFEIGVEIARLGGDKLRYTMQDVQRIMGAWSSLPPVYFQASTRAEVRRCVSEAAGLVAKYFDGLLDGETAPFDLLESATRAREQSEMQARTRGRTSGLADEAWHARDYPRVIELYESIVGQLTKVEMSRLVYAKRHVRGGLR